MTDIQEDHDEDTAADGPADAVALFRPADREALVAFLDLDDEDEESDGIYAEELEDGSFLLFTFQPFALFAQSPDIANTWLAQFGEARGSVHDDPRGILFFPDDIEPEATTYDGVVAEIGDEGVWVAPGPGIDMEALHAIASQLIGPDGKMPTGSFDIGRMFSGLQGQIAEALGMAPPTAGDVVDMEPDEPPPTPSSTKEPKKT